MTFLPLLINLIVQENLKWRQCRAHTAKQRWGDSCVAELREVVHVGPFAVVGVCCLSSGCTSEVIPTWPSGDAGLGENVRGCFSL